VTVTGYPSAKLDNFTSNSVKSGTTIAGVAGAIQTCSSDGQIGCISSTLLPSANISGFSTWNLRIGTTLAGVSGSLKLNCRNMVDSSTFNYDGAVGSLGTGAVTSGTVADYWDTVDDFNGYPTTRVAAWSTDTVCDNNVWEDKTTTNGGSSFTTCGTSSTCIYRDKISDLQVTGILANGGNTTTPNSPGLFAWNTAVQKCNSSTYGGYPTGTWRLPTQKELLALYEHGIWSLASSSFISYIQQATSFWSATNAVYDPSSAWLVELATGYTTYNSKGESYYIAVCVK
jgi:Protein of unknown function (DUF1566)